MVGVAAALERARWEGLTVRMQGHRLTVGGPRSLEDLAREILSHKAEVVQILEAEEEYERLHGRVFALIDAAEASERAGAHETPRRQRAEAKALIEGPYWEAGQRLRELLGHEWVEELDRQVLSAIAKEAA